MRTVCIYHNQDLDGQMSAAIVKHWFETDKAEIQPNVFLYRKDIESLTFIGYNYGEPIPDLSEYNKVIMCDISFPKEEMISIIKRIGNQNLVWIDHHISALKDVLKDNITEQLDNFGNKYYADTNSVIAGNRSTNFAACELTWKYFFPEEPMPEIVRLLGRYDCFGHKGTEEEELVLGFQYGARQKISNYEEAHEWLTMCLDHPEICNEIQNAGDEIYKYLCTEAKQVYKTGFEIEFPYAGVEINNEQIILKHSFICVNKERFNPINFGIDYHKDGYDGCACFYFDGTTYNFSLYNDNGLVDCSQIAKQFGGGGHKGASGFRLDIDGFNKLIKNGSKLL